MRIKSRRGSSVLDAFQECAHTHEPLIAGTVYLERNLPIAQITNALVMPSRMVKRKDTVVKLS